MTTFDAPHTTGGANPQAPPRFELEYLVDDVESPTEVTVVPAGGGTQSGAEWITADIRHAVPIEWVR